MGEKSISGKVLIVDDDAAVVRFVSTVVEKAGLDAIEAHSADEAMKLLAQEDLSLAIIDVRLPDRNGVELATDVKAQNADIPVIMITGFPGGKEVRKSLGSDVDAYLVKPVNPSILLTLLHQLVGKSEQS